MKIITFFFEETSRNSGILGSGGLRMKQHLPDFIETISALQAVVLANGK